MVVQSADEAMVKGERERTVLTEKVTIAKIRSHSGLEQEIFGAKYTSCLKAGKENKGSETGSAERKRTYV